MNRSLRNGNIEVVRVFVTGSCTQEFLDKTELFDSLPDSFSAAELLALERSFERAMSGPQFNPSERSAARVVARGLTAHLSASDSLFGRSELAVSNPQPILGAALPGTSADGTSELVEVYRSIGTSNFRQAVLAFARVMGQGKAPLDDPEA